MSGVIIQELIPRWKGYNSPFARYYPTVDLTFNLKLNPFLDGLSNKFGTRIHEKTLPFLRDFHEITHRFTMTTPIGAYVTKLEIQGNVLMQLACELKNSQPNLMPAIKDELLIRQIAINRLMTEWQPLQEAWALVFVEYLTKQQKKIHIPKRVLEYFRDETFKAHPPSEHIYAKIKSLSLEGIIFHRTALEMVSDIPLNTPPRIFLMNTPYTLNPSYMFSLFYNLADEVEKKRGALIENEIISHWAWIHQHVLKRTGNDLLLWNAFVRHGEIDLEFEFLKEILFTKKEYGPLQDVAWKSFWDENSDGLYSRFKSIISRFREDSNFSSKLSHMSVFLADGVNDIETISTRLDLMNEKSDMNQAHLIFTSLKEQTLQGDIYCLSLNGICRLTSSKCSQDCSFFEWKSKHKELSIFLNKLPLNPLIKKYIPPNLKQAYQCMLN